MLAAIALTLLAGAAWPAAWPQWPAWLVSLGALAALAVRLAVRAVPPLQSGDGHERPAGAHVPPGASVACVGRLAAALALLGPMVAWSAWRAPVPATDDLAHCAPRRHVRVEGRVLGVPDAGRTGWRAVLAVERAAGRPAGGRVIVTFPPGAPRPAPGWRFAVVGRLARPGGPANPGAFDAAAHWARRGVFASLRAEGARPLGPAPGPAAAASRAVDRLRLALLSGLAAGLAPERAALAGSLVLGGGAAPVPDALAETFRDAGLAHLLAASGAQVGLLAGLAVGAARLAGLPPPTRSASAVPVLALYLALTGAPAGMVRATLMAAFGLVALATGLAVVPFAALWATVALMLVADPGCVHDMGFQFSVLATYGLLRLAHASAGAASAERPADAGAAAAGLRQALLAPAAAWTWVAPWQAACFAQLPLAALPANWLAAPLVLALTPWGLLVAAVGMLSPALAAAANRVTSLGLAGLEAIARLAVAVPGQLLSLPPPGCFTVALLYAALAAGLGRPRLAAACAMLALAPSLPPTGPAPLEVAILAVGQGDAIALRTPGGAWVLVDGGPAGPWGDAGAAVVVPWLRRAGCRGLALMVASHAHGDHVGGLPALTAAFPPALAWESGHAVEGEPGDVLLAAWLARGVPWLAPPARLRWSRDGVSLEALARPGLPESVNDGSLVLRVRHGATSLLLPGDLEAAGEAALLAAHGPVALRADVLKVGHHGARGSSTAPFLAAVRPRLAVVSAGPGNVHGHPHAEALARLRAAGATIARTDEHGAVLLRSDGSSWSRSDGRDGWRRWRPL